MECPQKTWRPNVCVGVHALPRVQSVCLKNSPTYETHVFSHIFDISSQGVLQGSVLGPLIFFSDACGRIRLTLGERLSKLNADAHLQGAVHVLSIHC